MNILYLSMHTTRYLKPLMTTVLIIVVIGFKTNAQEKNSRGFVKTDKLMAKNTILKYLDFVFNRGAGLYGGNPYNDSIRTLIHPSIIEWGSDQMFIADSFLVGDFEMNKTKKSDGGVLIKFFNVRHIAAFELLEQPKKEKLVTLLVKDNKIIPFSVEYYNCRTVVDHLQRNPGGGWSEAEIYNILKRISCQ